MTGNAPLLIGVGNPMRGDDGVGPAVVDAVRRRSPGATAMTAVVRDPTDLLDLLAGAPRAIIVDAVRCEPATPGRLHRLTADEVLGWSLAASTHGFGIPAAFALAKQLGRPLEGILVLAVEGKDFDLGNEFSPEVAKSIPKVIKCVQTEMS